MVHRSQVVTVLLAELWTALLFQSVLTGVSDGFPVHVVTNNNGSSKLELSSLKTAGTVEAIENAAIVRMTDNSSSWYAAALDYQSDRYRHAAGEKTSDRLPRQVTIDDNVCFPSLEQLKDFQPNQDDPLIAAALSLSKLAEVHDSQFNGIPQYRRIHKQTVCDVTTRKLNHALAPQNVNGTAPCPWTYTCSYEDNRYPQYIVQAICQNNYCSNCGHFLYPCLPVQKALHVLRWNCSSTSSEEGSGSSSVAESLWPERIDLTLACRCNLRSTTRYSLT